MKQLKNKLISKYMLPYYILIIITLIIGFPLLKLRMLNGHDSIFHLFRNNTTISAIQGGQLIPMINPNMMGGLGYAPNMFYGVLSTYIIGLFNILSPTLGLSINILTLFTIFLSGLFMYRFVKEVYTNDTVALISAIIYMASPYHLYDIYVRGSLGEIMAFVFIPLLFHGLYNVIHCDQKKWYLVTIGTTGLLLSHNISTFISAIFAILYLLLNVKKVWNKKVIQKLIISLFFAFLISLITIVPLIEAKLSSDYMVFDSNYMHTTAESMTNNSINLFDWSGNITINLIMIFYIVLTLVILIIDRVKPNNNNKHFVILNIVSLILTLNIIPWNILPSSFSLLQFPWRFLHFTSFFVSIISAYSLIKIIKKINVKKILLVCSVFILFAIPFIIYGVQNVRIDNNLINSNSIKLRDEIARSTGMASAEYLPKNAIFNYEYLKSRGNDPLTLSGDTLINNIEKDGTVLNFSIKVFETSIIELPYIYYPGYIVKSGNEIIDTFETENGLVGIELNKGTYNINSKYRGTSLMIGAYFTSFISLIIFITVVIIEKKKNNSLNGKK